MARRRSPGERTPAQASLLARKAGSEAAAEAGRQAADFRVALTGHAIAPALAALGNQAQLVPFQAAVDPHSVLPLPERTRRAERLRRGYLRGCRYGWAGYALPPKDWAAAWSTAHAEELPHA